MCANKTSLNDTSVVRVRPGSVVSGGVTGFLNIRTLGPNHRKRLLHHLLALEAQDRYLRFGYAASDQQITAYIDRLDFVNDVVFGVFNHRLEIVGMAHVANYTHASGTTVADFGVTVSSSVRGKGVGGRLYERAALYARNAGVDTLQIQVLAENAAMLAIARKRGASVLRRGPESEAYLQLPRSDLGSRLRELYEECWANLHYRTKAKPHVLRGFMSGFQALRKRSITSRKACSP
nr:GNAT family N-acetyltransferase [uncultured Rhodoferax sp.]